MLLFVLTSQEVKGMGIDVTDALVAWPPLRSAASAVLPVSLHTDALGTLLSPRGRSLKGRGRVKALGEQLSDGREWSSVDICPSLPASTGAILGCI